MTTRRTSAAAREGTGAVEQELRGQMLALLDKTRTVLLAKGHSLPEELLAELLAVNARAAQRLRGAGR